MHYLVKFQCHFSWQVQYLVKFNFHFSCAQFPCSPLPPLPFPQALKRFRGLDTTAQSSDLVIAISKAVKDSFPASPPEQRKPYRSCSSCTLQFVKQAQSTSDCENRKSLHQKKEKLRARHKTLDASKARGRSFWSTRPTGENNTPGSLQLPSPHTNSELAGWPPLYLRPKSYGFGPTPEIQRVERSRSFPTNLRSNFASASRTFCSFNDCFLGG